MKVARLGGMKMATCKQVQDRIQKVEGFRVRIKHLNAKDVKLIMGGFSQYPYKSMAKSNWRVSTWKIDRFKKKYQGFRIVVLDGNGRPVHGLMLLKNVRNTYKK
jgi:hypothetical protein